MPTACSSDEIVLLELLKSGDKQAFNRLYALYSRKIFLNLLRLVKIRTVAEEILQDIFVLIWEKRETIVIHQCFDGYIARIAENKAIDFFRRIQRDKHLMDHLRSISSSAYTHVEENMLTAEAASVFRKAIDELPPQRKQVFCLCKVEGKSYNEVSHLLGISVSTINDHIVKATRTLKEHMISNKETATMGCLLCFVCL